MVCHIVQSQIVGLLSISIVTIVIINVVSLLGPNALFNLWTFVCLIAS